MSRRFMAGRQTTIHTHIPANLESPISLRCAGFWTGRKSEEPYADIGRTSKRHTERPGIEPTTFMLWGGSTVFPGALILMLNRLTCWWWTSLVIKWSYKEDSSWIPLCEAYWDPQCDLCGDLMTCSGWNLPLLLDSWKRRDWKKEEVRECKKKIDGKIVHPYHLTAPWEPHTSGPFALYRLCTLIESYSWCWCSDQPMPRPHFLLGLNAIFKWGWCDHRLFQHQWCLVNKWFAFPWFKSFMLSYWLIAG